MGFGVLKPTASWLGLLVGLSAVGCLSVGPRGCLPLVFWANWACLGHVGFGVGVGVVSSLRYADFWYADFFFCNQWRSGWCS